ncbi:hypothetical protein O973_11485 [Mycobacterium avium subsp. avium 11-4751]|nr:hypothetical protein O973_11485 [Mycobacterium avium subsp. avium 11-4751]
MAETRSTMAPTVSGSKGSAVPPSRDGGGQRGDRVHHRHCALALRR